MRCNAPTPDWRRIFFMEEAPLAANPPSLGSIEPHAGLLTLPPEGQLLYKIMTVENLLRSNGGSYLRFNRVDSYRIVPAATRKTVSSCPRISPGSLFNQFRANVTTWP
jgi:hypothetical protein